MNKKVIYSLAIIGFLSVAIITGVILSNGKEEPVDTYISQQENCLRDGYTIHVIFPDGHQVNSRLLNYSEVKDFYNGSEDKIIRERSQLTGQGGKGE